MKYVIAFAVLLVYQTAFAEESHRYEFATIGNNRIAYSCRGTGQTTVILISGMGLPAHRSFGNTFHRYDGASRICLYDRAELGESRRGQQTPRKLADVAEELHTLATTLGWNNRILVAHSFGGFVARAYAQRYPQEVKGVVFVDSVQEDWLPALHARMDAADWAKMQRDIDWNLKITGEDFLEAQSAVGKFGPLGTIPITVITRGIIQATPRLGGMSYAGVDIFNEEHQKQQARLGALSSNSRQVVAKYASHFVDETDPFLIVDELKLILGRIGNRDPDND